MTEDEIIAASRATFLEEARDMLGQLEASLLVLADGDAEVLNAAFRSAHTIKGSAGLFGYDRVVAFTHEVETLLDLVRDGHCAITDPMVTLLLECRDQIGRLLDEVAGTEHSEDNRGESARLVAMLRRAQGRPEPDAAPAAAQPAPEATPLAADEWCIHVQFKGPTFLDGFDPMSFLRYLPAVGDVTTVHTRLDDVPALDSIDAEQCHLGFSVGLKTAASKAAIEAVFEFAADDCVLRLVPPQSSRQDMLTAIERHHDDAPLGTLLMNAGVVTPRELDAAIADQRDLRPEARIGEVLVERHAVPSEVVEAAAGQQQRLRERKGEESRFVRVPADKLDALISLIGEMVIAGSGAQLAARDAAHDGVIEATSRIADLLEHARDGALKLRMVPIGETFARFKRVVHDVTRQLGKEVELAISGGDAELDKAMVEQIVDPLTHLVRNALDHGLEPPAERTANGKAAMGRLGLHAYHESGSIVIEVSDDGRGLNRHRIVAKAVERGLVPADTVLTDADVFQLIFLPGFSTADKVTDISGRGVGMDVVRRNIEALRGTVTLASQPGRGSTVQIRLPLTLAIIDGFMVQVQGAAFVMPLDVVVECIETPPEGLQLGDAVSGCFDLRGEVLPLLSLQGHLQIAGTAPPRRSVVVVRAGQQKVGLLVDRLLGEHQTVIKPLGRLFSHLRGVAGSSILGSGAVALILDIPALTAMAAPAGGGLSLSSLQPRPHAQSITRPPPTNATTARAPVPTPDTAHVH
jgi:two-component system chemotaxis sensor kinase CheA